MKDILIAVGGQSCGSSPVIPYIGGRIDGEAFSVPARKYLCSALLRSGFDVAEMPRTAFDPQDFVMMANRNSVDCAVILSYSAFGSRRTFNGESGCTVRYAGGRLAKKSRTLGEDVCAALSAFYRASVYASAEYAAANCPAVTVEGGYLTNFDEACGALDPDRALKTAELSACGICEFFGVPVVPRDDITAYPAFDGKAAGKRGKKIKLLQSVLSNYVDIAVDGVYGKETEDAVRSVCERNGISAAGVTEELWRSVLGSERRPLEKGSRHTSVSYIKRKLRSKLYEATDGDVLDADTLESAAALLGSLGADNDTESGLSAEQIALICSRGGEKPRLF